MTLACLAYTALDRFRKTALATKLFYRGVPVEERGYRTVRGVVVRAPKHPETDGDCTFDVMADGVRWHMEVTPCAPKSLRDLCLSVTERAVVSVSGMERHDPAHFGADPQLEIHPVTALYVLHGSE